MMTKENRNSPDYGFEARTGRWAEIRDMQESVLRGLEESQQAIIAAPRDLPYRAMILQHVQDAIQLLHKDPAAL
jgi:hypothetical protein